MFNQNVLYVIPFLSLYGTFTYAKSMYRGHAKPNRVSMFLWAFLGFTAFAAELNQGVGLPAIITFTSAFGPLIIFAFSFMIGKSYWKLDKFDYTCGILALLGLFLWAITKNANLAIIFAMAADFLAGVPTLVKSYTNPESESYLAYFLAVIASILTLLVIDTWTLAYYAWPVYLILFCGPMVLLVRFRLGLKLAKILAK